MPISDIGLNPIEIPYDVFVQTSFDPKTDDQTSLRYQEILSTAKSTVDEWGVTWDRIIFLQNPDNGKTIIWFD